MSANVEVSYARLDSIATALKTGRQNISDELLTMKSSVDNLVGSGFQTPTSSARFAEVYQQLNEASESIFSIMDSLSGFLLAAEERLKATDSSQAQGLG